MCSILHLWGYGSKDTPLKKEAECFLFLSWWTFKQPAVMRPRDQKADHDAGLASQFICLHLWWLFLSLPFWSHPNNHNNILHWRRSHYFRYESDFSFTGNYKYTQLLSMKNILQQRQRWRKKHEERAISLVLMFRKFLCEFSSLACDWRIFCCKSTKGDHVLWLKWFVCLKHT